MPNSEKRVRQYHADRIQPLRLVEADRLNQQALRTILVKSTTPWKYYTKIYSIKLGEEEPFVVAEKKGGPAFDVVSVRSYHQLNHDQLQLLQLIQHPNFVTVHEVYHQDGWHIITEHMTRSLQEVVGNPFLDDLKLAAIAGQVCMPFLLISSR